MIRPNLLVVDGDPGRLMLLADRLRGDGYDVTAAVTGKHVTESLDADPPDLAILGPSIAPGDAAKVAGWIRDRSSAPILQLRPDRVDGSGRAAAAPGFADRALTMPFSHGDVLAAIGDLLARTAGVTDGAPPIRLDAETGLAQVAGRTVQLSPAEARLVRALLVEPGVAVSTSDLVAEIWPADRNVDASSVWILVWRVRRKVEIDPKHPTLLVSVPGEGYRLAIDAAPEPAGGTRQRPAVDGR